MTAHWDELFMKLHNQQILQEELDAAQHDQDWMTVSVEEAMEGLSGGLLTLPDGQEIRCQTLHAFEDQLTISVPHSLVPEVRAERNNNQPGSFVVQDKSNGIVFGLHQTKQELEHSQVEAYQQQMIEQAGRLQAQMKLVDHKILPIQDALMGCSESLFLLNPFPYYQIAFVRSWHGKAYIGSCQFKLEDAPLWVPLTYAMLHTAVWAGYP